MIRSRLAEPLAEGSRLARKVEGVLAPIVSNESYEADRGSGPFSPPKAHKWRRLHGYPVHFPPQSAPFRRGRKPS